MRFTSERKQYKLANEAHCSVGMATGNGQLHRVRCEGIELLDLLLHQLRG